MTLETEEQRDALVYPEPLFDTSLVDGAAFLYFEQRLVLTLAPAPTLAGGGFEMADWVVARRPDWRLRFLLLNELWASESDGCIEVMRFLEPLKDHFTSALIAVPGDLEALERAGDLIRAADFDRPQMRAVLDPVVAAGELMNHLHLEMWLALDRNTAALYDYTAELFCHPERLEETMQRAYVLRIAHLPARAPFDPLLLNNPRLVPFLLALGGQEEAPAEPSFQLGHASWELFRRILRPYLNPLTTESALSAFGIVATRLRPSNTRLNVLRSRSSCRTTPRSSFGKLRSSFGFTLPMTLPRYCA